jgi:hypothetical protein
MLPLFPLSEQHSESLYTSQYSEVFIIQANDSSHIIERIELAVDILRLDGYFDEEKMRYYLSDRDYSHVFEIILSPRKHQVNLMFLHREGFNAFYQTHLVDAANSDFYMLDLIEAELHNGCEDVKDTASFWFEDDFGIEFYEWNEALAEDEEQNLDHSEDLAENQVNYLNAGNNRHYNENYSTLEKSSYFEARDKVNFQPMPDPLRALRTIDILIERDKSNKRLDRMMKVGTTNVALRIRNTADLTVGTTLTAKPDSIPARPAPPAHPPEKLSQETSRVLGEVHHELAKLSSLDLRAQAKKDFAKRIEQKVNQMEALAKKLSDLEFALASSKAAVAALKAVAENNAIVTSALVSPSKEDSHAAHAQFHDLNVCFTKPAQPPQGHPERRAIYERLKQSGNASTRRDHPWTDNESRSRSSKASRTHSLLKTPSKPLIDKLQSLEQTWSTTIPTVVPSLWSSETSSPPNNNDNNDNDSGEDPQRTAKAKNSARNNHFFSLTSSSPANASSVGESTISSSESVFDRLYRLGLHSKSHRKKQPPSPIITTDDNRSMLVSERRLAYNTPKMGSTSNRLSKDRAGALQESRSLSGVRSTPRQRRSSSHRSVSNNQSSLLKNTPNDDRSVTSNLTDVDDIIDIDDNSVFARLHRNEKRSEKLWRKPTPYSITKNETKLDPSIQQVASTLSSTNNLDWQALNLANKLTDDKTTDSASQALVDECTLSRSSSSSSSPPQQQEKLKLMILLVNETLKKQLEESRADRGLLQQQLGDTQRLLVESRDELETTYTRVQSLQSELQALSFHQHRQLEQAANSILQHQSIIPHEAVQATQTTPPHKSNPLEGQNQVRDLQEQGEGHRDGEVQLEQDLQQVREQAETDREHLQDAQLQIEHLEQQLDNASDEISDSDLDETEVEEDPQKALLVTLPKVPDPKTLHRRSTMSSRKSVTFHGLEEGEGVAKPNHKKSFRRSVSDTSIYAKTVEESSSALPHQELSSSIPSIHHTHSVRSDSKIRIPSIHLRSDSIASAASIPSLHPRTIRSDSMHSIPSLHRGLPIRSDSIHSIPSLHHGHPMRASSVISEDEDKLLSAAYSKARLLAQYSTADDIASAWLQHHQRPDISFLSLPQVATTPSTATETTETATAKASNTALPVSSSKPLLMRLASHNFYDGEGLEVTELDDAPMRPTLVFLDASIHACSSWDDASVSRHSDKFRSIRRSLSDEDMSNLFLGTSANLLMKDTSNQADANLDDDSSFYKDYSLRIIRWIDILIERDKIFCAALLYFFPLPYRHCCVRYQYIYWYYCTRTLHFLFSFSTPYLYLPLAHRVQ